MKTLPGELAVLLSVRRLGPMAGHHIQAAPRRRVVFVAALPNLLAPGPPAQSAPPRGDTEHGAGHDPQLDSNSGGEAPG